MKITFLGSSHGVPEANRRCQSIMIEVGGKIYFVDMGTQSIEQLITKGKAVEDVKSIFITHLHGDHSNGLISFIDLCNWYFKKAEPEVYIPGSAEKVKSAIEAWLKCNGEDMRYFKFEDVKEGAFYNDGIIKMTAYRTKHKDFSYAYLLEAENKRVFISGDLLGPKADFPKEAFEKNVDLAICECAHFNANDYLSVFENNENLKKLCITHYSNRWISSVMELKSKLSVPFLLATDGLEIDV